MGRPKKITNLDITKNLTELQVQNIFDIYQWNEKTFRDFAQASNNTYLYPQALTPMTLNSRMQSVTLAGSGQVTPEMADQALLNPRTSEKQLLQYSEILEYSNPSYKRILQYLGNLPAWDYTFYCKNASKISEYGSKAYQKALDIIKEFTSRFDVKTQMPILMRQLLRQEVFFSVLREDGDLYVLQELPSDYCLITGRFDYGLLFSFNYYFFQQQGISLDLYPPVFKETYLRLFTKGGNNIYSPSSNLDTRGDSLWTMYADCSPTQGFWMWKFSPELIARIPQFASLFPDMALLPTVRAVQKANYLQAAAKILFTELPFLKDTKASLKDATALSPRLLGEFMAMVQAIIGNEYVKFVEAPINNAKALEFKTDNKILSDYSRNVLSQSGTTSNLISNYDQKMNAIESQLAANVDEQLVESVYPSANLFMEYHINKRMKEAKLPFRFGFKFEGTNFYLDRNRRLDTQNTLMDRGIVLPQKIAAAIGMSPFELEAHMNEAISMNWIDKLTPIIGSAQLSGSTKNAGRPSKSDSDLSDSAEETRSAGSNLEKGGNI